MAMPKDLLDQQIEWRQARIPYALATVVEILGSSSAKPSSKALIGADGRIVSGWIGGGCAQSMVCAAAIQSLETKETQVVDIDLNDEVFGAGMPCGGSMRVYVEPVLPKPLLWLMGHGRIVESLCEFAYALGFDIIVNDAQASSQRFPVARIITDDPRYRQLRPEPGDFVVIATHHKGDYDSLTQALASQAAYIALIASRKRAQLVLSRLTSEGFTGAQLARVSSPAGLDLGAKLPEEIALSIISEIVLLRRGGSGMLLRQKVQKK
ncbi:MAG: XdhC family protein [Gammaproteobacteria bacterium]